MHMHKTQTPVLADKNAEQVVGFERTETVVAHPSMGRKMAYNKGVRCINSFVDSSLISNIQLNKGGSLKWLDWYHPATRCT